MRKKIRTGVIIAICSMVAIPTASVGHHGVNGQFDLSQTLTKKGTVTRVRFVNPHSYVYFDVIEDNGDVVNWRCELRSGSLLRRKGWSADLFEAGTEIEIFGSPARTEPTTCYTEKITFSDSRTLLRYGEISDDGSFVNPEPDEAAQEDREGRETEDDVADASDMPDFSGVWGEPIADGPPLPYAGPAPAYVLTEAAIEAGDDWTPEDNPRFNCQPTNIILDYRFDQMLNNFEQSEDELKITYGFMDVERVIHIDGEFPDDIEPSVTGYSVGGWNDDKLEVITKGFAPGFLQVIGGRSESSVPHSDQMEIAETFYIDENEELVQEYTITDPVNLVEPHSHLNRAVKSDYEFVPYDCDDLTEEEGR